MNIEQDYIYIGIALIVIVFVMKAILSRKKPPTEDFVCARCKSKEKYTNRTIEAWRRGFKKIYCQSCHQLWLKNNPHHKKQQYHTSGGGCYSVLVLFALISILIHSVIKYMS